MEQISSDTLVRSLNLLRHVIEESGVSLDDKDYGRCPFHDEQTASFHIFQAQSGRARYHCFGCEAGGDIFNFLKLTEKLGFRAAMVRLTDLVNKAPLFPPENPEWTTDQASQASQTDQKDSVTIFSLREQISSLRRQVSTLNLKVDRLAYLARCVRVGFPEKIHEAFDQLEPEDFR